MRGLCRGISSLFVQGDPVPGVNAFIACADGCMKQAYCSAAALRRAALLQIVTQMQACVGTGHIVDIFPCYK
jgi:hypothetical protein